MLHVPDGFRYNYIVPLPKPNKCFSKLHTRDDFRGIAICPILSKVFEYYVLDRFKEYLVTNTGRRPGLGLAGCGHSKIARVREYYLYCIVCGWPC